MEYVLWIGTLLVLYSYFFYPLLLILLNKITSSSNQMTDLDEDTKVWPDIAIIIAAYNEEEDISNRLNNIQKLDYPKDKVFTYIGSDGSDDATNSLVQEYEMENLQFSAFSERRGKASVLNDLCSIAKEEILIFSDANTQFDQSAIKAMVTWFKDPTVGGVCGELEIHSQDSNHDGFYWKYEKTIKENENKINGLLGANGAIYAVRKKLFKPIDKDTIIDDFMIAMNIVLQGYKLIYESRAVAHETAPDSVQHEFKRRVRIGTGNYQAFFRLFNIFNPLLSGVHFFTYISHKVIRWFTPHILIICFILNLFLIKQPFYLGLLILQVLIYLSSIIMLFMYPSVRLPKLLSLILFFINMNIALFVGFVKYITSNVNPAWDRTNR